MATVTDHENLRAEIVFAFADALRIVRQTPYGDEDALHATEMAFQIAAARGWDAQADESFSRWCLKATEQEILVEGLCRALQAKLSRDAAPSAPAPVTIERCTSCKAPAHPSETDDAGDCERCRTGAPHRAPQRCEIHECLFEACDCPACEHCAGFGCQVCGWSGRLLCEHCGRPRVGDRDECGGIGDGICADRAAAIDALLHPAASEVLAACFFCHHTWGQCTCRWADDDDDLGFEHEGSWITKPNVSICGRFFVNPETCYGDSYKRWAAKR